MDDKAASKKPLDTPFRQQTLKAWRPILTPKAVIVTFSIVGIIFIPIGCVILSESDKVVEVENDGDYGDACCLANCAATDGTRVDKNPCFVNLTVPTAMAPPVYMYYKLSDFYQNHRRYVKSRSDYQLRGDVKYNKPSLVKAECSDVHVKGEEEGGDLVSNMVSPCGLVAWSLFNDSFVLRKASDMSEVTATSSGIAWASDKSYKFINSEEGTTGQFYPPFAWERQATCTEEELSPELRTKCEEHQASCDEIEASEDGDDLKAVCKAAGLCFKGSGYCMESEHFMVWMRTAGLPTFRKLYAIIDEEIPAGEYVVEVSNGRRNPAQEGVYWNYHANQAQRALFPVHGFDGQKMVVLSTVSAFGGKNPFLGVAYVVVGAICLALALLFLIKDRVSPRKLGDPSYITFNKKEGAK